MAAPNNDNQESVLEEAVRRFLEVKSQGQGRDIDEFAVQYAELGDQIRKRVRNLREIDTLFDSLIQAEARDFNVSLAESDLSGRKIGGFEIVEVIDRGGMGVVYLARDTKLDRSVAIKSLPPNLTGDVKARTRLKREAKLLASLNHPNIGAIYDIVEWEDGSGYLILEYVPGETLAQCLAREPLKLEQAFSIGRQIAEAVSAAHENGVIHRDLKPSNVKITPDGQVKVLDFGLAKVIDRDGQTGDVTATEPGHIMGTPAYMSPEQASGKSLDQRTDIWSFGCVMYQMLTGQRPFEGETATEILAQIIKCEPDWEVLSQDVPPNICTLLHRCLEKTPDHRQASMAEVCTELSNTWNTTTAISFARSRLMSRLKIVAAVTLIVLTLSMISVRVVHRSSIPSRPKTVRLIVLPFEPQGSEEWKWFADGVTDEVTTRLAGLHSLSVTAPQTAIQCKRMDKTPPQMADELDIDYVLEGTIQFERPSDPNSLGRIRLRLIRATDQTQAWVDTYPIDMNENTLRMQTTMAEEVAQALDIRLLGPERRALQVLSTESVEAWKYYSRGNAYYSRGYQDEANVKGEIAMLRKAIECDHTFALAHAKLSKAHSGMYKFRHDRTQKRLEMALGEAYEALQLDPQLPEAHWALGWYYYWGLSDAKSALEHFGTAREKQPSNPEFLRAIAYAQRYSGQFDQALTSIKQAYELDPWFPPAVPEVGHMHFLVRQYQEAEPFFGRALELDPNSANSYLWQAQMYLTWKGSTEDARAVLEQALRNLEPAQQRLIFRLLVNVDIYDKDCQTALDRLDSFVDPARMYVEDALIYARIHGYMDDRTSEKTYYESALNIIETILSRTRGMPTDTYMRSSLDSCLGMAYAGLDRREEAIRAGRSALELLQPKSEVWPSIERREDLARIYVMVGKADLAIDTIEHLLENPGKLSVPLLNIDPAWDPLRVHPRFKKLLRPAE